MTSRQLANYTFLLCSGLELAHAVLEAGGCVACVDILSEPSLDDWTRLQARAKQFGLSATYNQCDITNETELERTYAKVVEQANSQGKPLNGVIGCAGIQQSLDAINYPAEDINRIMNVNVTGTFLTAKYAAREFIRQGCKGSIVLIASMSGQIANRVSTGSIEHATGKADIAQGLHCSAYNSSKAAVHQMARSLAQEWGQHGIRVNTLSPGYIRTAMTDKLLAEKPEVEETWMKGALLNRLGAPEDFKAPAVFLLAPGSSFMTGADLRVDGGHCASG